MEGHGMNSLRKCSYITLTIFGVVLLFFAPSWGADWEISPRASIVEEYNDNILFSREDQELDDLVTYVRPRVEGTYQTERFSVSLGSGIEAEKYIDHDELDTIDHDHRLALAYALSRTLSVRTGGYFREDTTLETELIEEGLLVDREDRRKFGGNLGFNYAFSDPLSLSAGWTRRYSEYPDDPQGFDDRQSDTFDLAPRYVLSRKTSLFLKMLYARTEYDGEGDRTIENYNIRPSFRHDFAEDFYVSGGAGYRYTERKTVSVDEDNQSFVFDLSFHRDWKKVSMELLASKDQYSTVDRRSIERDRLTLKGSYRLSTRFRTSIAGTFRRNREDEGGDDTDYFTVSPALSYNLTPTIVLKGSVDYSDYDYEEDSDWNREQFRARLLLNLTWPRLLSGK
jgi:hypothetical protein